jgi:hypothetical protein
MIAGMSKLRRFLIVIPLAVGAALLSARWTPPALAFPVSPLPEGNLIANPWFHEAGNPDKPSEEGWVDEGGLWGPSNKGGNPSPYGEKGTGARFASGSTDAGLGFNPGGLDAYLYTVVQSDPANAILVFKTHYVTGYIEIAEFTIYGSQSPDGPWQAVWVPLSVTPATEVKMDWQETPFLATTLPAGFPYYKIEAHGRYQADRNAGFKFSGIYFTTLQDEADLEALHATVVAAATPAPGAHSDKRASREPFLGYYGTPKR